MAWFKLDDKGAFHTKVIRAGNEAYGAWCRAGQWSSDHLTNGFIPDEVAILIAPKEIWERLSRCGGEGKSGLVDEAESGWQIHDFLDWNPSGDQVAKARKDVSSKRSSAGKVGAKVRWQNDSKRDGKTIANAWQTGWQNDGPVPVPVPISDSKESGASASASAPGTQATLFDLEPFARQSNPEPLSGQGGADGKPDGAAVTPESKTPPKGKSGGKKPRAPIATDAFWSVWRETYQARYKTRYQDSTGDGKIAERVATLALRVSKEVAPGEDVSEAQRKALRHWFTGYLSDRSEFLVTQRHSLRFFERDITKHGNPWDSAPPTPAAVGRQHRMAVVPEEVQLEDMPSIETVLATNLDDTTQEDNQ